MTDTVIKKWYLVGLESDGNVIGQILWGIVVEDKKGRWISGDYVCTSPVVKYLGEGLYQTKNSQYLCQGEGCEIVLEAEALIDLRGGYSPDEYLARKGLKEQGYQVQ